MIYNKDQISKIIAKASEIQTAREMNDEEQGLSENEIIEIAEEIGISRESVVQALQNLQDPKLTDQTYSLWEGTSKIQHVDIVNGDFTEEQWEELVLEIRKITGGIGKIRRTGNTYEWEQRKTDFGYKHFSLTPSKDKTKIQMVSSWGPFKLITGFLGFFFVFILTFLSVKGLTYKELALMVAPIAGLGGFAMSRFYLKYYFRKQQTMLKNLSNSLQKKILSFGKRSTSAIQVDSKDLYKQDSDHGIKDSDSPIRT